MHRVYFTGLLLSACETDGVTYGAPVLDLTPRGHGRVTAAYNILSTQRVVQVAIYVQLAERALEHYSGAVTADVAK